uniref:Uncharacterized protein n=1 Tax=viral metagenome TaxID=1070528 RepID=A0A6C0I297_9ZZZZ
MENHQQSESKKRKCQEAFTEEEEERKCLRSSDQAPQPPAQAPRPLAQAPRPPAQVPQSPAQVPQQQNLVGGLGVTVFKYSSANTHLWQTRNAVIDTISRLVRAVHMRRHGRVTQEWELKLPQIAFRLDEIFFLKVLDGILVFEDYANVNTLMSRLQAQAREMVAAPSHPNTGSSRIDGSSSGGSYSSSDGSCSSSGDSCSSSGGSDTDISDIALILQNLHLEEESAQEGIINQAREEGMGAREEGEDKGEGENKGEDDEDDGEGDY